LFVLLLVFVAWVSYLLTDTATLQQVEDKVIRLTVEGRVSSVPIRFRCLRQFSFKLHQPLLGVKTLIVHDYHCNHEYQANQILHLPIKMTMPQHFNKDLFASVSDKKDVLQKDISKSILSKKNQEKNLLSIGLLTFKQQLYNKLLSSNLSSNGLSVMAALSLGIKNFYFEQLKPLFAFTGITHMFAISGLHLGLIAWAIFHLVRYGISPWLLYKNQGTYFYAFSLIITGIFLGLYCLMIGFTAPTARAFCCMSVIFFLSLIQRYTQFGWVFFVVLCFSICFSGVEIGNPGFILSFSAVTLIYLSMDYIDTAHTRLLKYVLFQAVLSWGLLPIVLYFFHMWAYLSPLYNLLLVPFVEFILLPGTFLALLLPNPVSHLLSSQLLDPLIQGFLAGLQHLVTYQWSRGYFAFDGWDLCLTLPVMLMLFMPWSAFIKICHGFLFILVLSFHHHPLKSGQAKITLLDVGQGLSLLVQTQHHRLLYDTGVKFYDGQSVFLKHSFPYMRAKGMNHVDALVISHGDNDHSGGYSAVMQAYAPTQVYTSAIDKLPFATLCLAGVHWTWDEVQFAFLFPNQNFLHLGNNSSCVLKVTARKHQALLTGDIEALAEKFLVKFYGKQLSADLLQVPHHGSKSSSTKDFILAVNPKVAWISAGRHNPFGLPAASVMRRYHDLGIDIWNTASMGSAELLL